jgi:purine-nucleoside phosphorylase
MEASVLFYLAARAGVQAACLLTVSDVLNEEEGTEETYMSLEDLDAAVERMIEVALTAAVQSGP